MTPITDKIKQLPDGCPLFKAALPISEVPFYSDDLKALVSIVEDAVKLGHEQAQEWDRFWQAIGCGSENISVDDAIAKYQALVSDLEAKTRALEHYADERHWASAEENGVADWYDPTSSGGSVLANGYDIAQAALKSE